MKQRVTLNDRTFEVMIPAEEIDKAIVKVAEQLGFTATNARCDAEFGRAHTK